METVIAAAGSDFPIIVGLTDVENDDVLNDLMHCDEMKSGKYGFIHYESKDDRGIDVAMILFILYQPLAVEMGKRAGDRTTTDPCGHNGQKLDR